MKDYCITAYGAIDDGKTVNTAAIQRAVDDCTQNGGGRVIVDGDTFVTGTVVLKSNVELHITAGTVLMASPNCGTYRADSSEEDKKNMIAPVEDYGDYPDYSGKHVDRSCLPRLRGCALLFAEAEQNITVSGQGVISGNGAAFVEKASSGGQYQYTRKNLPTPPRILFFAGCANVSVKDITIVEQPAGWSIWVHDCDDVHFDRLNITANPEYPNSDGIHINCSRRVTVSNCLISTGDDCIIVRANSRSLKENKVSEGIVVTNCTLSSRTAGIRIGWVNDGTIRNCTFSNLVITDYLWTGIGIWLPDTAEAPSDYGREATLIENLTFTDILMDRGSIPILIDLSNDEKTKIDKVRNLYFHHIHARAKERLYISGRADNFVENVCFSDCSFEASACKEPFTVAYTKQLTLNNTRMDISCEAE